MRDKGINDTKSGSGKVRDCSQADTEDQTKEKRIKLSNPEPCSKEGGSNKCHNRKSRKDNTSNLNKKCSKDKSENMIEEGVGDGIVLDKDSVKKLKKEEKAHKATQEQVKTLKTKIRCLTSDYNELHTQLAEMEENMNKFNLNLPANPEGNTIYDPAVHPTIDNEFALF